MQDRYPYNPRNCADYCSGDDHPIQGTEDLFVWWGAEGAVYIKSFSKNFNVVLKHGDSRAAAQQLVHEIAAGQHQDLLLEFLLKRET